ncbi:MAG: hypothetical protein CMM58_04595 [Rhodospirillaceae bacterium]|nr:hypothetical protein [Rhodospirillaceae bacterium]
MRAIKINPWPLFKTWPISALIIGILVFSAIFTIHPDIDRKVAGFFYNEENNFILRNTPLHYFVDNWIRPIVKHTVILLLALSLFSIISRGRYIGWKVRSIVFVGSAFIIGPIILVNGFLKEFIGRARPKNITDFGGDKLFSPAYFPADQCAANCSFVSGDAAAAFTTLAFGLLYSGRTRLRIITVALGLGTVTSLYRIGTGAHFLSDTLFAGLFCILITLLLEKIMLDTKTF